MWLYNLMLWLDLKGFLLFMVAFLIIADYLKNRNPPNYPPGPLALPLVGNIFNMDSKQPHIHLSKLAGIYGNVFNIRIGRDKTVFVCGYKMVKEALVTLGENFADRPFSPLFSRVQDGKSVGLFFSNGLEWKKLRRFSLSSLRNFGLGKSSLEQSICEESRYLQEEMENQKGEPFNPTHLFNNAVSNIICQMVFGRRFEYTDHKFQSLLKYLSETMMLEGSVWAQLYEAFPDVMKHLPGPHNNIFSNYKVLKGFITEHINRHRQDRDPSNPRDYIDVFLAEIENLKDGSEIGFTEENLVMCSLDLFLAGTDTTSTTLQWALVFLITYPHIQEKVQAEIDRVIGQHRQPNMADRPNLPYTDAVIHEIQRMGNILPFNGLRQAAKDTTLGGHFIPKGTAVMPILTSVLFDKNEWETPDSFNPEHFLDKDGKFVRRDAFMPFSAGKRVCLGEGLARMELFLFFVSLFQKFTFSTLDGVQLSMEGIVGITRTPYPFKIYAKNR